ncbi:MAG: MFS transporter [Allosphingosinicella sp.]
MSSDSKGWSRWYVVGLLAVLYVFSYADRLILALLVTPLKADLGLSDTQIALLIGPAFAFLYAILGIPVAWLADRFPRVIIAVGGVAIWSAATIASAFAGSFEELFVLRMGLALGEAVLSPVAVSLISDLFHRSERSTPTAVFVSSGTIGLITAYVIGGALIDLLESGALAGAPIIGGLPVWRATLVLVGAPGLILAVILAFTVREPERGVLDRQAATPQSDRTGVFASFREALHFYVAFFLGNSICMTLTFAVVAWFPTFLTRAYGVSASESGYLFGFCLMVGAFFNFSIPTVAQRLARGVRKEALLLVELALIPVGLALFVVGVLQDSLAATMAFVIVGFGILSGTNALSSIAVALTAPPFFRGRLMAISLACSNLIGLSLGPFAVARVAETQFSGPFALAQAMLVVGLVAVPLAWLLILVALTPYRRAMRRAD